MSPFPSYPSPFLLPLPSCPSPFPPHCPHAPPSFLLPLPSFSSLFPPPAALILPLSSSRCPHSPPSFLMPLPLSSSYYLRAPGPKISGPSSTPLPRVPGAAATDHIPQGATAAGGTPVTSTGAFKAMPGGHGGYVEDGKEARGGEPVPLCSGFLNQESVLRVGMGAPSLPAHEFFHSSLCPSPSSASATPLSLRPSPSSPPLFISVHPSPPQVPEPLQAHLAASLPASIALDPLSTTSYHHPH
ncbi:unnamed protein product [Closterium sp. Naga37s-1]|nr:unnamed protein product [Closterium sp. Naga37s-1]